MACGNTSDCRQREDALAAELKEARALADRRYQDLDRYKEAVAIRYTQILPDIKETLTGLRDRDARIAELEGALRELGDRAHLALCNPRQDFMSVVLTEVRATARALGKGGSDAE